MNLFSKLFAFLSLYIFSIQNYSSQPICNSSGNLIVFSNYDGGVLNININENIANLKIGICTYEPVKVNFTGAFASNITQVIYAGFNSTQANNNCGIGDFPTSFSGVPSNITSIIVYPPANVSNPNGSPNIVCSYNCVVNTNTGGCNTPDQVVAYFIQQTNATFRFHHTQYNCWLAGDTYNISTGGNCCESAQVSPVVSFTANETEFCEGTCVNFTNTSTGGPFSSVNWSFPGATPSTSTVLEPLNICYNNAGVYPVTLTLPGVNGSATTTQEAYITVGETFIPEINFTYPEIACKNESGISPNLEPGFSSGGVFTINNAGVINSTNGEVDLSNTPTGNYQITYTYNGNDECISTGTNTSTGSIQILDLPDAGFNYEQGIGYTIEFTNSSSFGSSYLWDFGNGNTSTQENPSFTFPFEGLYPTSLIVSNDCGSDTINVIIDVLKLSTENLNSQSVVLYPNPAKDIITFKLENLEVQNISIRILDLTGRLLIKQLCENKQQQVIDISNLRSGIYWIEFRTQKERLIRRFSVIN